MKGSDVFYDGSPYLNGLHINCNVFSDEPQACVHNSKCGWCGDKNSCIPGTFNGPLAPCLKSTFLFNAPSKEWNPLKAGTININTEEKLIIAAHPDMGRVISNPYN
jgi:hypothetical protein